MANLKAKIKGLSKKKKDVAAKMPKPYSKDEYEKKFGAHNRSLVKK